MSRRKSVELPPWGRGPGRPPGVAAGGGRRPRHCGGAGGRCPRTTPARPERAPLRPSRRREGSAVRAPEQGKHPWGTLSPRPRAPAGFPPLWAGETTGGRRPAPPPRPGVPRAPGARRRSLGPRRPATAAPGLGLAPGPSGAHSGPGRPHGAQESTGDLPRPPMAGVTLPPNHSVGRALPGSRPGARRRRAGDASRAPSESPPPPPQAVPVRRRGPEEARPFSLGGAGSGPDLGRCPARPPGKENASKPEGRAVPRPRDSSSAPRGCGPSRPPGKDEVVGLPRRAASENQDPRPGSCPAVPNHGATLESAWEGDGESKEEGEELRAVEERPSTMRGASRERPDHWRLQLSTKWPECGQQPVHRQPRPALPLPPSHP
ncbi:bcl-2-binding component 3, isoforms 3/4-like [Globicephala melas]|uniref:bcl-2-binding component 3, isoforms 3/4-like n=1 Tax=Globicephala melas TaxID=9731 RepID=UPI00293D2E64|nr:basic salivary proline-rich protein 1-like [Globicephala melas]